MTDMLIKTENSKRDAKMDILRIVAMLFIVLHHLDINNIGLTVIQYGIERELIPQYLVTSLIDCFIIIGVNLFFLLSGYFKIDFKPKKIFTLVFKVYIYWIIATLLGMAIGVVKFASVWDALKNIALAISKYWFVATYILLLLCAPLLNALVDKASEKPGGGYIIFVLLLFFSIVGFIADYFYPLVGTNKGYSVIWAGAVYIYGRLIRLNEERIRKSVGMWTAIYILFSLLNYAIVASLIATGIGNVNGKIAWHFFNYNNPLILISSVAFFMIFISSRSIKNAKLGTIVSLVGSHTLAVYLWHSNNPLFSPYRAFLIDMVGPLWAKVLLLLPNAILVFALGILIDIIYELLLSKPLSKLSDVISGFFVKAVSAIGRGISKLILKKCPNDERNDS